MGESSGEAPGQAPTTKDPDSTKDLLFSSIDENINQPIRPGDTLPAVCETDPSKCGSFLSSDGPCARYSRRGCVLRHQAGYRAVTDATPATRTPGPAGGTA